MIKKVLLSLVFILISQLIFSFGSKEVLVDAKEKTVVGLLLNAPGIGDDSINDSCYLGLQKAANEGLITLRVKTSKDLEHSADIINNFVSQGVDLIYAIGESNKVLLLDAAVLYTDTVFIGIDILFEDSGLKPNLFGINFREQDGGYLAGLVAGSLTYKYYKKHNYFNEINTLGVIIGKDSPEIKRYEVGFYAGVKKINPPCEIITININDLNDPEKAAEALKELKTKGVDIVFTVAGESDLGVFRAAEESMVLIIGANRDLSSYSENILTSVEKKLSISTYLMTKNYINGIFTTGVNTVYGLNEGAISLAPYYKYDMFIPKDLQIIIEKNTAKLLKGSEVIPDTISEIIFDPLDIPEIAE